MATDVAEKISSHFSKYPKRSYAKGQIMIHAGDEPQYVFYVISGKIRQYDISYRGDEVIVNIFKPGAFFPMLWAMTGEPNKYFFDAETDVEVHVAPRDESIDFLKENPDVLYDLLSRVYRGVEGLLGRMVHLMSGNAQSRLLYELVVEAERFGKPAKDSALRIAINEGDLAARAGLSRETVSREIKKINRDNLLIISHAGITINDLPALKARLGDG